MLLPLLKACVKIHANGTCSKCPVVKSCLYTRNKNIINLVLCDVFINYKIRRRLCLESKKKYVLINIIWIHFYRGATISTRSRHRTKKHQSHCQSGQQLRRATLEASPTSFPQNSTGAAQSLSVHTFPCSEGLSMVWDSFPRLIEVLRWT